MSFRATYLVLGVLGLSLAGPACGSGSTPTSPTASAATVVALSITGLGALTSAGQTNQLTATAALSNGTTQNVTSSSAWLSSNTGVATVSSSGLVTAVATGTATITATYQAKVAPSTALVTTDTVTSITITGTASLSAAGQTSQLTATASLSPGTSQNIGSAATWQSSNIAVVTVSSAGLVTAVSAGTTTITVTYQGKSGTLVMVVTTPVASITFCQSISAPGQYALTASLNFQTPARTCLIIAAKNVNLDCGGHSITVSSGDVAIAVSGAQDVSINNCTLVGAGGGTAALDVAGSANVTITNSTVTSNGSNAVGVFVDSSPNVTLSNNTIAVSTTANTINYEAVYVLNTPQAQILNNQVTANCPAYVQYGSSFATVTGNTFTGNGSGDNSAEVYSYGGGNHNTFTQNTISGGWNGVVTGASYSNQGADDGIFMIGEDSDTVQGNTISNVYDAGVESVGVFTNAIIANNTITSAGFAGIGSYWGTNWIGNMVQGNRVSGSPYFGFFDYDGNAPAGGMFPPVTSVGFQNNTFTGNSFFAQTALPSSQAGSPHPYSIVMYFSGLDDSSVTPLPYPFTGGNNVIQGNNLVTSLLVLPPSLVVDNGGNTCGASMCIGSVGRIVQGVAGRPLSPPRRSRTPLAPHHLALRVIRR